MDMDNDDSEHETENDEVEVTGGHETGDSTSPGSGRRSRKRNHTVMLPLVPDSVDGKSVIKPSDDG
jgi:hypothetical protein